MQLTGRKNDREFALSAIVNPPTPVLLVMTNANVTLGSVMLSNPCESPRELAFLTGRPVADVKADLARFVQYGNAVKLGGQYSLTPRGERLVRF